MKGNLTNGNARKGVSAFRNVFHGETHFRRKEVVPMC